MSKLILSGCLLVVAASGAEKRVQREVILRLNVAGNIPIVTLVPAKTEAAAVLHKAGLRVHWESADSRPSDKPYDCLATAIDDIEISVVDPGKPDDHPGALGYALPFAKSGVRVVIFYDRIIRSSPLPNTYLLGFTIAHEVGHVLIGTLTHAPDGVMKGHWKGPDYSLMQAHRLTFTEDDDEAILRHVKRKERFCMEARQIAKEFPN